MKNQSSIISRGLQFISLFIFLNLISEQSLYGMYSNKDTTNPIEFSYKESKFCSNDNKTLYPKVNIRGGKFSYVRNSTGEGELIIDTNTGKILKGVSDPGEYTVTYSYQDANVSFTITVVKCNS